MFRKMRLHLSVQRHDLPPTQILWSVSDHSVTPNLLPSASHPHLSSAHRSATVAQLLEDVNEVVPLESAEWGLEDYSVEVDGYECLHYMPITEVLKDGDNVVIRALQTHDLRLRQLGGRHQISNDGRHLIDGVAFGKPWLKRTRRPQVHIPPRKKVRLEVEDDAILSIESAPSGGDIRSQYSLKSSRLPAVARRGVDDEVDGEQDDDDYDTEDEEGQKDASDVNDDEIKEELRGLREDLRASIETEEGPYLAIEGPPSYGRRKSMRRCVRFSRGHGNESYPGTAQITAGDEDSDGSEHVNILEYRNGRIVRQPTTTDNRTSVDLGAYSGKDEKAVESSSPSSSDSDSESSNVTDEEDVDEIAETQYISSASTGDQSFAEVSTLAVDATSDIESSSVSSSSTNSEASSSDSSSDSDNEATDIKPDGPSTKPATTTTSPPAKPTVPQAPPGQGLLRTQKNNHRIKKRKRLARLKAEGILPEEANFADLDTYDRLQGHSGGSLELEESVDADELEAKKRELSQQITASEEAPLSSPVIQLAQEDSAKETDAERTDNLPVPQDSGSTEDEIFPDHLLARRRKLDVASSQRLLFGSLGLRAPKNAEEEAKLRGRFLGEKTRPSNEWRMKVNISAVECEMEGVKLKPPPFPFEQRWDAEADEQIRALKHGGARKRQRQSYEALDMYPKIELDFTNVQDESGLGEQTTQDAEDLPAVPLDLTNLESLQADLVRTDAIIIFQQLEVSEATGWAPVVSPYRTAKVLSNMKDGTIELQLAFRDIPVQKTRYDEETGNRLYSKFDVPDMEEGEKDTRIRELLFENLLNAKLLVSAPDEISKESNESLQRIPESFPEAQETANAHDTPEISLIAVDIPEEQELSVPTQDDNENHRPARSQDLCEVGQPSFQNPTSMEAGIIFKDMAEQQVEDANALRESYSPRFNGFGSLPDLANNILSESPSLLDTTRISVEDPGQPSNTSGNVVLESFELPDETIVVQSQPASQSPSLGKTSTLEWKKVNGNVEIHAERQLPSIDEVKVSSQTLNQQLQPIEPASRSASKPSLPRRISRDDKPFFQGLDGTSSSDEFEFPSLEQIASQVSANHGNSNLRAESGNSITLKPATAAATNDVRESQNHSNTRYSSPYSTRRQSQLQHNQQIRRLRDTIDLTQSSPTASQVASSHQANGTQYDAVLDDSIDNITPSSPSSDDNGTYADASDEEPYSSSPSPEPTSNIPPPKPSTVAFNGIHHKESLDTTKPTLENEQEKAKENTASPTTMTTKKRKKNKGRKRRGRGKGKGKGNGGKENV